MPRMRSAQRPDNHAPPSASGAFATVIAIDFEASTQASTVASNKASTVAHTVHTSTRPQQSQTQP